MEENNNEDRKPVDEELDPEVAENMKLDLLDMPVTLSNVVARFSLGLRSGERLELVSLVMRAANIELKAGRSYVTKRLREPACSANIFASGKVTMIGAKSEAEARLTARKVVRMMQKLVAQHPDVCTGATADTPVNISLRTFRIVNIWASSQGVPYIDLH